MKSLATRPQGRKLGTELLVVIAILLVATYVLAPRFWEPRGESWKQWVAARILRETGGFPVLTLGPLYVCYLQIFQLFDYPVSIRLEYFLTHLFVYTAIFLMLRSVLPATFALLLTCAWIPMIAVLESGGTVAGIGFAALYFRGKSSGMFNKGYFPASLLAATLCHSAYLTFLIGNVIGVFVERRRAKQPVFAFFRSIRQTQIFPLIAKVGLIVLIVLAILLPSNRWDHNHMLVDGTYWPLSPKRSLLTIAFFQFGIQKYIMRTVPESLWVYQDWYFTHEKVFGGATTILQALLRKPDIVIKNILENMLPLAQLPRFFTTGNLRGSLAAVFWVLLPVGLLGLIQRFKSKMLGPLIFSIILGAVTVVGTLLLSRLTKRYVMVLLPIALLIVGHIGPGLWCLVRLLKERALFVLGCLLVFTGIILNEWTVACLSHRVLSFSSRLEIWSVDILLIVAGIIFMLYRPRFLAKVKYQNCLYVGAITALVSAEAVFFTAAYPKGTARQIKAVLNKRAFLSEAKPVSMTVAYPELLSSLNGSTSVLALEDTWIKAFSKADLNKVYSVSGLPPFPDPSGRTERLLNGLDTIWVSYSWSAQEPCVATQPFLRYRLHIAPFLEKAMARGWTEQEVAGYGKIYRRPIIETSKERS